MSKNVNVDGKVYSGVSKIQLNTTDGVTALFQDVDEISASGGGVETGTFVGDGTRNVTIPVTSKKTGVAIWMDNYTEELANATQYQTLCYVADSTVPILIYAHMYGGNLNAGVGFATKLGNSGNIGLPEFTDNSIVITKGAVYAQETFVSGKTYHWKAW